MHEKSDENAIELCEKTAVFQHIAIFYCDLFLKSAIGRFLLSVIHKKHITHTIRNTFVFAFKRR